MKLFERFLDRYSKEYDFYLAACSECAYQIENQLNQAGVKAIVSHRAKRYDRLSQKLHKLNTQEPFKNIEGIYKRIPDLGGIRVALYFPGDLIQIDKIINYQFSVIKKKEFPISDSPHNTSTDYTKIFSGYKANHYHIFLKEDTLADNKKHLSKALMEVQVASVLMHAWSEVEHDLVYKPFSGDLSHEELAVLDEINGLVLTGEIALRRLQSAMKSRIDSQSSKFNNHYELSTYIIKLLTENNATWSADKALGRTDLLFKLLDSTQVDKPAELKNVIKDIEPNREDKTVVDQIIDQVLTRYPELYSKLMSLDVNDPVQKNNAKGVLIASFIRNWIHLEELIFRLAQSSGILIRHKVPLLEGFLSKFINDKQLISEIDALRRLRNTIVHLNTDDISTIEFEVLNQRLDDVVIKVDLLLNSPR
jgi:ppGpp synthetase/RelA/SpoT-type nucleotidyltranferase